MLTSNEIDVENAFECIENGDVDGLRALLEDGLNANLSLEEKLFGKTLYVDREIFLNHIMLLTKWYIHRSRIQNVKPEVEGLKIFINQTRVLEERIAIKGNKLRTHNLKWQFCDL